VRGVRWLRVLRVTSLCFIPELRAEFVIGQWHLLVLSGGHEHSMTMSRSQIRVLHNSFFYSSDHNRIVRSFSIDADAINFRVGCVYGPRLSGADCETA